MLFALLLFQATAISGVLVLLLYLLVGALIIWGVLWFLNVLGAPVPVRNIVLIIVALVILLWWLSMAGIIPKSF